MPDRIPLLDHRITQVETRIAELDRAVSKMTKEVTTIKAYIVAAGAIGGTLVPIVSVIASKVWG